MHVHAMLFCPNSELTSKRKGQIKEVARKKIRSSALSAVHHRSKTVRPAVARPDSELLLVLEVHRPEGRLVIEGYRTLSRHKMVKDQNRTRLAAARQHKHV